MTEFINNINEVKLEVREPTEFVKHFFNGGETEDVSYGSEYFKTVELIKRNVCGGFDLIFATTCSCDYWLLGHWNDGC